MNGYPAAFYCSEIGSVSFALSISTVRWFLYIFYYNRKHYGHITGYGHSCLMSSVLGYLYIDVLTVSVNIEIKVKWKWNIGRFKK